MTRKLPAIICIEGIQAIRNRLKQANNCVTHLVCCALINLGQQAKTRSAFSRGNNVLTMAFADDGVHFPIANLATFFNDCWALFNSHSIGYFATPLIAAIAFASLLLAAQVPIRIASCLLVCQNVLVDPFVTDPDRMMPRQRPRYLFRAPIPTELRLNHVPRLFRDALVGVILTAKRLMMCLLLPIATLTFVPT